MSFKVVTNIRDFIRENERILRDLADPDKILRTAVANQYQTISERIQQRGENTAGRAIEADFASGRAVGKRRGAYSVGHSYRRQSGIKGKDGGRQISRMDWTLSGDLMDRGYIFTVDALGFTNTEMFQRAQYLEDRFGRVFWPSDQEFKEIFGFIEKRIDDVLKKRS